MKTYNMKAAGCVRYVLSFPPSPPPSSLLRFVYSDVNLLIFILIDVHVPQSCQCNRMHGLWSNKRRCGSCHDVGLSGAYIEICLLNLATAILVLTFIRFIALHYNSYLHRLAHSTTQAAILAQCVAHQKADKRKTTHFSMKNVDNTKVNVETIH